MHCLQDRHVICRPGGPYWEKLCQRSWVRPEGAGRGPNLRPRAQFFTIRTNLGRQITYFFFFRSVLYKQFLCWIFTAAIFKHGVRARLTLNIKSTLRSFAFLCFLGHYLHFKFLAVKKKTAGKDPKAVKWVPVRTWGPDEKIRTAGARKISQSDSRI